MTDRRAVENHLAKLSADKPRKFYTYEIMNLTGNWEKVPDNKIIFKQI